MNLTNASLRIVFFLVLLGLVFILFNVIPDAFFGGPSEYMKESETEIVKSLDSGVRISLSTEFPPVPTENTSFFSGEGIYPLEEGLPKGILYAFRVVDMNGTAVIPLDVWPYSETRVGYGFEGNGNFNSEDRPISLGKYTVQLVKVFKGDDGKKKAFIVAEKNITIMPRYAEEEMSGIDAWITKGDDPASAHLEILDMRNITNEINPLNPIGPSIGSIWVRYEGKEIRGKAVMKRITPEGEEDPSFYREFSFATDPSGKAVRVFSISGTLHAGNYPIDIMVEGKIVKQLSIVVSYKSIE